MSTQPKVENAPGLAWKPRKSGWEARWQARTDLVKRGYRPKSFRIWSGAEPSDLERAFIAQECNRLQTEMLVWGRGGLPVVSSFDGTVVGLIASYQTDVDSPYRKLRYETRRYYDTLCRRIEKDQGNKLLVDIKARDIRHWHDEFVAADKIPMGHSVIGMFRTLMGFGGTIMDDKHAQRLSGMLGDMRFTMAKPRVSRLTAEQAITLRAEARKQGHLSIALAQAIQFECMLRQKDVIGEWVPTSEPGISDVLWGNNKWLRGVRWEEIDGDMILRHITSKRQKEIVLDLKHAGMVIEELGGMDRARFPASGPIVVRELHNVPWSASEFRRIWRGLATDCGIPKNVRNMDSRAGAITEATEAGADLEHIKHAATHSDISMTQRYARGGEEKAAGVMLKRQAHRNKNKTG